MISCKHCPWAFRPITHDTTLGARRSGGQQQWSTGSTKVYWQASLKNFYLIIIYVKSVVQNFPNLEFFCKKKLWSSKHQNKASSKLSRTFLFYFKGQGDTNFKMFVRGRPIILELFYFMILVTFSNLTTMLSTKICILPLNLEPLIKATTGGLRTSSSPSLKTLFHCSKSITNLL